MCEGRCQGRARVMGEGRCQGRVMGEGRCLKFGAGSGELVIEVLVVETELK